jgi:phosphoribosylaminoimidazole (AIR) synthetase
MMKLDYKKSGVDINAASTFKAKLKPIVRKSFRPE